MVSFDLPPLNSTKEWDYCIVGFMKEIYRKSQAESAEIEVYGRAYNGKARVVDDEITIVGQDSALSLSRYGVVGVFDGAGGAVDVGSPERAALMAAQAVRGYYQGGGGSLAEAIEVSRRSVEADAESGVCVGTIARLSEGRLEVATVGDVAAVVYDPESEEVVFNARQQVIHSQPTNYMGRRGRYMPVSHPPLIESYEYSRGSELYVMSDGATGTIGEYSDLEDYHFVASRGDYQVLEVATRQLPELEDMIRRELAGSRAQSLRDRQLAENTNSLGEVAYLSPGLDDPNSFTMDELDWAVWEEVVRPMVRDIRLESSLGAAAVLGSLVDRPIAWRHERLKRDDATIVRAKFM